MSARVINFPAKSKKAAKKDCEKFFTVKAEPPEKELPEYITEYIFADLSNEMFPPDYFILVE